MMSMPFESVEPLFDFDDTKTLLLWFLTKLLSVSKMNLTPKIKVSLRMLKIQHPGLVIRIPEVWIWISIPESIFEGEKMKFGLVIQIPEIVIRILIPESVFEGEEMKFGRVIRIPEIVIWIPIPESFLNSEKVKFGIVIRMTKGMIRILNVKAADKSWICTPTKITG